MKVRRFVLRLIVGLLCFLVGWTSAVLLGAAPPPRRPAPPPPASFEVYIPQIDVPPPPPPRFEHPPCGGFKGKIELRHTHEWDDVLRGEEFEFEVPPPAPRPRRRGR